jgi:hypothetical protein
MLKKILGDPDQGFSVKGTSVYLAQMFPGGHARRLSIKRGICQTGVRYLANNIS